MLKQRVIDVLWTAALCLMVASGGGCGGHDEDEDESAGDSVTQELERHLNDRRWGENFRIALALHQNGVVDPQPVAIAASVYHSTGHNRDVLMLMQYDEEADIVGLGLQEEKQGTGREKDLLVEEYPVFTYNSPTGALHVRTIPVHFRQAGERKNEQQWRDYLQGKGSGESFTGDNERFWKTLPPVYVSIPEPNKVDVRIYVYDRGGHKSNLIRLVHQEWKPPKDATGRVRSGRRSNLRGEDGK
jgi:hypothetical protein